MSLCDCQIGFICETHEARTEVSALEERVATLTAERAAAAAEIARLRGLLRPFAMEGREWIAHGVPDDFRPTCCPIDESDAMFTLGDLRRARDEFKDEP